MRVIAVAVLLVGAAALVEGSTDRPSATDKELVRSVEVSASGSRLFAQEGCCRLNIGKYAKSAGGLVRVRPDGSLALLVGATLGDKELLATGEEIDRYSAAASGKSVVQGPRQGMVVLLDPPLNDERLMLVPPRGPIYDGLTRIIVLDVKFDRW